MTFILGTAFLLAMTATAVLFWKERRRSSLQVIEEPTRLTWATAAVAMLIGGWWLALAVSGRHDSRHAMLSMTVHLPDTKLAVTAIKKLAKPSPKPVRLKPHPKRHASAKPKKPKEKVKKPRRVKTVRHRPTPKIITVYMPAPHPAPTTTQAAKQEPKPKPRPKPKPKPIPQPLKVIAPYVWVIANVSKGGGNDLRVDIRLREYRGSDIVKLDVIKSGTAYRYYYKHKADQLCQVVRPGTKATSPVCVRIQGGSQVITFTDTQA